MDRQGEWGGRGDWREKIERKTSDGDEQECLRNKGKLNIKVERVR